MLNNNKFSYKLSLKLKIIKEFGFEINPQSVILDFGCGSGEYVKELREHGYEAFGCDISFKKKDNIDTFSMIKNDIIKSINLKNYILPFKDNTFDLIISEQVFEHIRNYTVTISEISRLLKPNGVCLHIFPSIYKPIESHVLIPFSSVIKSYFWVHLWVLLGIRNKWQDCQTVKERSIRYYNYLKYKTNYLPKKQIEEKFRMFFKDVIFCEKIFLKYSRRGKHIYAIIKKLPFISSMYSTFRSRVILTRLPQKLLNQTDASNIIS